MNLFHPDDSGMFTRAMYGEHAVQVPLNLIFQRTKDAKHPHRVSGVFQADHPAFAKLLYGEPNVHTLVMCDGILRPHVVIGRDDMVGHGIAAVYTQGFLGLQDWAMDGDVLFLNEQMQRVIGKTKR